ncbi:hypothetical protein MNBD_UNCLBAC01-44 [hydrothermal vent metagenome]|uniref:DUF350 domain-containing protein n=1 Tax=hydrothermal vent metagenome TaxID=652676 RepID=A0A3B1D938_9ZZZZ
MKEQLVNLLDVSPVMDLLDSRSVMFVFLSLALFYIAKKIYDMVTSFDLNHELVDVDNKAVATSFMGFLFGVGIVIYGVLGDSSNTGNTYLSDLMSTALWTCLGIVLLVFAGWANDKFVLYKFNSEKELVQDKNVGTGAVQCGAFIASALIIRACLTGGESDWLTSLVLTLIYFDLGQIFLVIYSYFYQKVTSYDVHEEIEKDNAAAGVSFGMSLVAVGVFVSAYIEKNDSVPGLIVWFMIGVLLLLVSRYVVDKIILPGSLLDSEIKEDQNWGAALIEGSVAIILAFILTAAF